MKRGISFLLMFTGIFLFAGADFFGVQTHFGQFRRADMDSLSMERQLDLCREAGIRMIRDECLWSDVERDSGVYIVPQAVSDYVSAAKRRDIDIYMILNYNNTLYAPSSGSGVTTEENRIAYARYCKAMVAHFAPLGITHYEIWNEPNHGVLFWTPRPDPGDYTLLLEAAYDSIKAVDSSVTVIGCATSPAIGNPAPFIEGLDFIRDVFAAGGGEYMDAVSFHLYQVAQRPEYEFRSYMNSVRSCVGDKPVYFSEFGYPTHDAWPNISLQTQAQYVVRMYLAALLESQLKAAIYYDLKNDGTNAEEPEHNFGLLHFDRTPKPAYHAMKTLTEHVGDLRPVASQTAEDRFILTFSDSVKVLWSYSGTQYLQYPVASPYWCVRNYRGDTLEYHISARDTLPLSINESPKYLTALPGEPRLRDLRFDHQNYLLYPGETLRCDISAVSVAGPPVVVDPQAVNWTCNGGSADMENGVLTANAPGEGYVTAELQGIRDTLFFTVIGDPGIYIAEDFDDTAGFSLESGDLDMDSSRLYVKNTGGREALAVQYAFEGDFALATLRKDILIEHHADSLFVDLYCGNEAYGLRIYCRDAAGRSFLQTVEPRQADWQGRWESVGGELNIDAAALPPVVVDRIYLMISSTSATESASCKGEMLFDDLRIKRGDVVNISAGSPLPRPVSLSQNYPNPFNGNCRIDFTLPQDMPVRLDILDLRGRIVATPLNGLRAAGTHHVDVAMQGLPSGLYIYRLSTPESRHSKKIVLLK